MSHDIDAKLNEIEMRLDKIESGLLLNRYIITALSACNVVSAKYLPEEAQAEIESIHKQLYSPNAERDELLERYMTAHTGLDGE